MIRAILQRGCRSVVFGSGRRCTSKAGAFFSTTSRMSGQKESESLKKTLEGLNFDNKALRELPVDESFDNTQRRVTGACFSRVRPAPVENPSVVCVAKEALDLLDLDPAEYKRPEFKEYFSGNKEIVGTQPSAHCYCGHQFGYFSGQLGDGATMYLGEVVNGKGERWEIQFKGAGPTPYSRQADGRKVLRSSIREFLCSEAMFHLGVPTTRAGTIVTSDSTVMRDMFYDGNVQDERCTIILRLAKTFLRFGSFEIFLPRDTTTGYSGSSHGLEKTGMLAKMLDYSVSTFFPEIWAATSDPVERYEQFFAKVVDSTAFLVACWQTVGFCHGVMNTDNMSITGVTIDYGPFGFMEAYNPDHICNGSDDSGRYAFNKQPEIAAWNLDRFAIAIQHCLPLEKSSPHVARFHELFDKYYSARMMDKLGLDKEKGDAEEDKKLIEALFEVMEKTGADFTNTFRALSQLGYNASDQEVDDLIALIVKQTISFEKLRSRYEPDIPIKKLQMLVMVAQTQPEVLARLNIPPDFLPSQLKKLELMNSLSPSVLDEFPSLWRSWIQRYRLRVQSELQIADNSSSSSSSSSSSLVSVEEKNKARRDRMNKSNPRFVLRNYVAQNAIDEAEHGDFTEVQRVLELLRDPFDLKQRDLSQLAPDEWQPNSGIDMPSSSFDPSGGSCSVQKVKTNATRTYDQATGELAYEVRVTCSS